MGFRKTAFSRAKRTLPEVSSGAYRRIEANWLSSLEDSAIGNEIVQGKLFRIDTKRARIAVDSREADESVIVEASFDPEQLETLRKALNRDIELAVEIVEERRPYEQTARNRLMKAVTIRLLDQDDEETNSTEETLNW